MSELEALELRITGSKSELLRTLVAGSSAKAAGFGVPSPVPTSRARCGSNWPGRLSLEDLPDIPD